MKNYNRQLRNSLEMHLTSYMNSDFDLQESAIDFSEKIYKLEITQNPYEKLYREYMISVMYIDAYKLFLYRQKECLANNEDLEFLAQLFAIENLDDLLAEVSCNPGFLIMLVKSCYEFRQLGSIGKINVIKSLSETENEMLLEEFPMHQQDLETYDIEVNLNHILKYIENQIHHQEKQKLSEFIDAIILSVMGFIRNLVNYDYINAENLLIEIAKTDYKASKYLNTCSDDMFLDHIDIYETYSRLDIITLLMEHQEFLKDAIWDIITVFVNKRYNGMDINLEKIDDCKDTEVMKKLLIN